MTARREQRDEERRRLYPDFARRVLACETHSELKAFLQEQMPPLDAPGRRHFTNLDFFLSALRRPGQATDAEWQLYQELARRMVERGQWSPKALEELRNHEL